MKNPAQAFTVSPSVKEKIKKAIDDSYSSPTDLQMPINKFMGIEVIPCEGMPEHELLAFSEALDAYRFVEAVSLVGYEMAKEVFGCK